MSPIRRQILTDNGTLSFAAGDTVTLIGNCCGVAADRRKRDADGRRHHLRRRHLRHRASPVNSGGHLVATNSTFSIAQLSLDNGSVLNSGDLTGDIFNMPIYVPYGDVQYLGNNASFQQIDINAGTLAERDAHPEPDRHQRRPT